MLVSLLLDRALLPKTEMFPSHGVDDTEQFVTYESLTKFEIEESGNPDDDPAMLNYSFLSVGTAQKLGGCSYRWEIYPLQRAFIVICSLAVVAAAGSNGSLAAAGAATRQPMDEGRGRRLCVRWEERTCKRLLQSARLSALDDGQYVGLGINAVAMIHGFLGRLGVLGDVVGRIMEEDRQKKKERKNNAYNNAML